MLPILKSKVVGIIALVAGIGCFLFRILISSYFMGARPANPDPEVGLIYAFNQHGGIVYLTHFEEFC
jgi:hypothetical protein